MLLVDIARYLDGLGYVNFFETGFSEDNNCFINNLPEKPINVVVLYDTGGEGNIPGFSEIVRSFQVFVRDQSQTQANYISWVIYNALTSIETNGFINIEGRKLLLKAKNPPVFIGKDNNSLFEYSTNFQCWTQYDYQ